MSHLYRILGVSDRCTDDELKKAFQKKALLWHPDRQTEDIPGKKERAEHMFKEITSSYDNIVRMRETGQDVMFELHAAEQAHRNQSSYQSGYASRDGYRQARPGAGGMGNAQRDWQAHRAAYDKANRMPKDAPRRILYFCAGIAAMGLIFNVTMLRRAQSVEPSNQLIAGRSSLITISKGEVQTLWDGVREVQTRQAAADTALPADMRVFSGSNLATRIWKRRLEDFA